MRIPWLACAVLSAPVLVALFCPSAPASTAAPPTLKAYVSNTGDGTITVVDLLTMTQIGAPLDVGNSPRGSDVHPDQSKVYVVNQHAEDVIVIDTSTDQVITRTPVGGRPFRCGISPDGTGLYVACHTTDDVWKLNTSDNTAAQVVPLPGGGTQDVKVSPDGAKVLAMDNASGDVAFFTASNNQVIGDRTPVGFEPHSVAFSTDGATAIVVGEGETSFIDVASRTVVDTVLPQGEHEEVRVVGNIAYATNLAFTPPAVKKGLLVQGPTLDLFDMTQHTYLRSIPLGGAGANGLAVSPDGTKAWVTMRTSNELREVDLVTEQDTGRVVTLGAAAAPRSVSIVTLVTETPVVSYFLPRTVNVKVLGPGQDLLFGSGFYDDGGATVDYTQPVTIDIGGFSKTFPLTGNPAGTSFKFVDANLKCVFRPNLKGSSRGKFKMRLAKTTLTGVDPDQPVSFHFHAAGLPDAQGTVTLTAGRYRLSKIRGALITPPFFPVTIKAKVGGASADAFALRGGFAGTGQTPQQLGTVRFALGGVFSRTIAGSSFTKKGDVFTYKSVVGATRFSMSIDFLRELVLVKGSKVELGNLDTSTIDVVFDAGAGAGPIRNTVRLSSVGSKRTY